ncbi:hypothetical protein BT96DRAFT_249350 [Gymnopus androsaceus JB14]|uniref:Uncharacterized protein n=1 Tax=Gymnopus androsaceus JB14 TaxID=1447944 RepID=A0A6A4IMT7_9AGAR|nr:hypothetical protein BT96DRAFT_249350 [Gymnopus androsaceus JB14]
MSESLDADLYGDLYETDFADQAADEKPTEPPKQHTKAQVPVASEPADVGPITSIDTSSHSTYSPTSLQTPIPAVQQIPTFEDPSAAMYRESAPLRQGAYQNIVSEQRTVRPSEMKDDG